MIRFCGYYCRSSFTLNSIETIPLLWILASFIVQVCDTDGTIYTSQHSTSPLQHHSLPQTNLYADIPGAGSTRWSDWSACSRQCDGGVTSSNATCTRGGCQAHGWTKYKMCNEKPCHRNDVGFRDSQCSKFNRLEKRGRIEWTSFYNQNDPCRLYCRKVGSATVERKSPVLDGTKCLTDSSGICINGLCWISDCLERGSEFGSDECMVCGENGTLCGRYRWHMGHLSPCSVTCEQGVRVAPVGCQDALTKTMVDERFCDLKKRPTAKVKYCHKGPCHPTWVRGIWSRCSKTCGSGIIIRDVYCAYKHPHTTYKKVPDSQCDRKRPKDVASCERAPCPTWEVGPWSKCSIACGVGIQTRSADCVDKTHQRMPCSPDTAPVTTRPCYRNDQKHCANDTVEIGQAGLGDIYDVMQSDYNSRIHSKPRWKLLFKGPCSVSCGRGIRALTFQCQSYDYNKRRIVALSDLKCLGIAARPPELEECHYTTCYHREGSGPRRTNPNPITYLWRYTGYGPCSKSCLGGRKQANVECVQDVDRRPVSKILCDPTTQPKKLVVACNSISCPPSWRVGNWTQCSTTCGRGIETRSVECVQQYGRTASQVIVHPSYRCNSIPPVKTRFCGTLDCPPKWYAGEWSRCTPLCGGLRMRQVECRMRNSNGTMVTLFGRNELRCTDTRPDAWQPCGEENCNQKVVLPEPPATNNKPAIRTDNSRYVQTRKRKRIKLLVGGVSTIIPGTTLTIRCPVRHKRRADIVWRKIGRGKIFGLGRVRKSRKGLLKIYRARPTDAGVYECQSKNLKANWTLLFHSAREGESLFWPRKQYLNARAEKKPKVSEFQKTDGRLLSDDAVRRQHLASGTNVSTVVPYDFVVTKWSHCSVTCNGKGVQIRSVTCEVISEEFFKIVENRMCVENGLKKPAKERRCEAGECPHWVAGKWNLQCNNKCRREKFGSQYRQRSCQFNNGTLVKAQECPQYDSPLTERACENKMCSAVWKVSTFSKCSRTCGGKGVRTRMLRCVWKGSHQSAGRLCMNLPRPSLVKRCFTPPCLNSCKDSSSYCYLTKRLQLCKHSAYKKLCCATCTGKY